MKRRDAVLQAAERYVRARESRDTGDWYGALRQLDAAEDALLAAVHALRGVGEDRALLDDAGQDRR